jgi:hypothetical protein
MSEEEGKVEGEEGAKVEENTTVEGGEQEAAAGAEEQTDEQAQVWNALGEKCKDPAY